MCFKIELNLNLNSNFKIELKSKWVCGTNRNKISAEKKI